MNKNTAGRGPIIKEMIITPIAIKDPPLLNAAGLHAPYALRTIVELVTEDGIVGISEILAKTGEMPHGIKENLYMFFQPLKWPALTL